MGRVCVIKAQVSLCTGHRLGQQATVARKPKCQWLLAQDIEVKYSLQQKKINF